MGFGVEEREELDRARAEIGASADGIGGLVTLGLLPSTSDLVCSSLTSAVAAQFPGIRLRIAMGYAGNLRQWIDSGEIDLALLYGVERDPGVQSLPLVEEALWVVGLPSARLRPRQPVPLASLVGRPLVLPSGPHGLRTLIDHACAVANVELSVAVETNTMSLQKSLVLGGHGLTILPPIAFARELLGRQLSAAPLAEPTITRTIVRALPANRAVGRHVRCVAGLLVQCVKDGVDQGAWHEGRWLGAPEAVAARG